MTPAQLLLTLYVVTLIGFIVAALGASGLYAILEAEYLYRRTRRHRERQHSAKAAGR